MVKSGAIIIVDTREQDPLIFDSHIETARESLDAGDYAIRIGGVLDSVRIERKSVADCFHSFIHNYDNEKAKIVRAKEAQCEYILALEASASTVRLGHRYKKRGQWVEVNKPGISQVRQLMTLERKYGIKVWYCADRDDMAFRIGEYLMTPTRWGKK